MAVGADAQDFGGQYILGQMLRQNHVSKHSLPPHNTREIFVHKEDHKKEERKTLVLNSINSNSLKCK